MEGRGLYGIFSKADDTGLATLSPRFVTTIGLCGSVEDLEQNNNCAFKNWGHEYNFIMNKRAPFTGWQV